MLGVIRLKLIFAVVMVFGVGLSGVHRRLSDFIHQVVVNRRDEAVGGVA